MQNKDLPKLRECPFCGGEASVSQGCSLFEKSQQYEFVSCELCGGRTSKFFHCQYGIEARNEAINAWNRRANDGT